MDKIYEAYTNIVEGKMKDIEQLAKKIAKHIGIKFKPDMIKFKEWPIDRNKTFADHSKMKKGTLSIIIAADPKNPQNGQIAIMHSITPTRDGGASIKKYTNNNLSAPVNEFIKWSKPRPSWDDVNGAMRGRNSRM